MNWYDINPVHLHPRRSFQGGRQLHGDPWDPEAKIRNKVNITAKCNVHLFPCPEYSQEIQALRPHQGGQRFPEVPIVGNKQKHHHYTKYVDATHFFNTL